MKKILLYIGIVFLSVKPIEAGLLSLRSGDFLYPGQSEIWGSAGGGYGKRMGLEVGNFALVKGWYRRGLEDNLEYSWDFYGFSLASYGLGANVKYRLFEERKVIPAFIVDAGANVFFGLGGGSATFLSFSGMLNKTLIKDREGDVMDVYGGIKYLFPTNYVGPFIGLKFESVVIGASYMKILEEERSYFIDFGVGMRFSY